MDVAAIAAKLFGPGSPLEMGPETIKWTDGTKAQHHRGVTHSVFKKLPRTFPQVYAMCQQVKRLGGLLSGKTCAT